MLQLRGMDVNLLIVSYCDPACLLDLFDHFVGSLVGRTTTGILAAEVINNDFRSSVREVKSILATDARAGTGDHGDFAFESERGWRRRHPCNFQLITCNLVIMCPGLEHFPFCCVASLTDDGLADLGAGARAGGRTDKDRHSSEAPKDPSRLCTKVVNIIHDIITTKSQIFTNILYYIIVHYDDLSKGRYKCKQ